MATVGVKGLKIGQGRAFCVSKIYYWSAMYVNHDASLSYIQWRVANNRQSRRPVATPARSPRGPREDVNR